MAVLKQNYVAWFVDYPSTHEKAGQTVEVVPRAWVDAEVERLREALLAAEADVNEIDRLRGSLRVVLSFGTTLPQGCREIVLEALDG